jgi:hypothetical protein
LQLSGAIKDWFGGHSLNFFSVPGVMAVIILVWSSQNYPVWLQHLRGVFGVMKLRFSASVAQSHLGSLKIIHFYQLSDSYVDVMM